MRWTKQFLKLLALSEPQAPNPEERPTEHTAPATQLGVAGALCTRFRRAVARNPHQRAPVRPRATRPKMSAVGSRINTALPESHLGGLAIPEAEKREKCSATFPQRVEELRAGDYYGARVNPPLE